MCAILARIEPGDEVIMPSYTFVSTANAFALRGAKIRFADSQANHPNIALEQIEALITPRTRAIVAVHYAGVACPMDEIMALAAKHGLLVIEDAAQCVGATYKGRPLGSIGDLAAFSFHETKNIQCGQGGLAVVNNPKLIERAEYVWHKGTDRSKFARGEVDKYRWVDLGSSFLPGEAVAASLWAQLEKLDDILEDRKRSWNYYHEHLQKWQSHSLLPEIPSWAEHNAHIYYLLFPSMRLAEEFQAFSRKLGVQASSHYLSLHLSPYFQEQHDGRELPHSDRFTECLSRLPMYTGMRQDQLEKVVAALSEFLAKTPLMEAESIGCSTKP